jgi:hypothetical protein
MLVLGIIYLPILGDFMPEVFKKLLRRRLHRGFVKPGEPFSFFSPKEQDESNIPGIC